MKIKYLKINGFGKLKQKEIELKNGINIIYGENEAGKSSLLKFISSMFFGVSKNKNGKAISDFEKFKPWKTEEFSGKIEYELDNGKTFEIYREFKKKNPIIYNSEKENISKKFKEDKTKGIDFFEDQTGIDEETYFNTAIIEQAEITLNKANQISIIQKISNLVSSGDDNISFKKSLAQINKLQTEKVGTERTVLKPINIVNSKIKELENKKEKLEALKQQKTEENLELENMIYKQKDEEKKLDFLKNIKLLSDKNRLKYAEINFMKNIEKENIEKIQVLKEKLKKIDTKKVSNNSNIIIICLVVLIFLSINLLVMIKNKVFIIITIIGIISLIMIVLRKSTKKSLGKRKIKAETKQILEQLDILQKNQEEKNLEIIEKTEKINKEIEKEKQQLIQLYLKNLDIDFLESAFEQTYECILENIEIKEKQLNQMNLDIYEINLNKKTYTEKLEELSKIVEELENAKEEKEELNSLNNSYNLAKECLEKAYEEVKKNISPKFTKNLCEIISEISGNKYRNAKFTDEEGLIVELESGNYISAERLSLGTIDQMYLSLRLSALQEITEEKIPIILDEPFAYFDNERLRNILKYLNEYYSDYQILIFTCINREEKLLKDLNIPCSKTEL